MERAALIPIVNLNGQWSQTMNEAVIILLNMRGGCATLDNKVHALFRVDNNRRRRRITNSDEAPTAESRPHDAER
jgi:hypothetical protein